MTFADYIIYLFNLGVAMGAVLAFIVIAYNGVQLLNSGGNPSALSQAKSRIINALLGLAVLLVSYLLLTTINPDIVVIKNISLGNVQVNVPVFTPNQPTNTKPTMDFQEIPLGTVVESILSGNSSTRNNLPCYEYDENGDVVDKNNDGKIDTQDIVLDRDIFYCMKNLDEALRKKTETRLHDLIAKLDESMRSCDCSRVFTQYEPPAYITHNDGECPSDSCTSNCKTCGYAHKGCDSAPDNILESFGQYNYDPCPNRIEIDCRREEIIQLMNGTDPEKICYDRGWIANDAPKYPDIFTFKDGIERMTAFQDYFTGQVATLKQVAKLTKNPFGERLTMSEFHKAQVEDQNDILGSTPFGNYNASRYCEEYNCSQKSADGKTCLKYSLNGQKRMCKMEGTEESFSYAGDPATFYFSAPYNTEQDAYKEVGNSQNNTCAVYNQDYGGVIPIGETVDQTEAFGTEVAKRTGDLLTEIKNVYSLGTDISQLPEDCNSNNCKVASSNCCIEPVCDCGDNECCPPTVFFVSCYPAEPIETKCAVPEVNGSCFQKVMEPYHGCSTCCGGSCPDEPKSQDQYWACPYRSFCSLVKEIYQMGTAIDNSCYDNTSDKDELALRSANLAKVGELQKWMEREKRLFALSSVDSVKEVKDVDPGPGQSLIGTICPDYLNAQDEEYLACNGGLSISTAVKDRFYLTDELAVSRDKMRDCIAGYGYPYSNSSTIKTQVFNCLEGINSQTLDNLKILPEFPYPSTTNQQYQNCYPYNSSSLTAEQKKQCFYNISRVGDQSNPGCQTIVEDYMDNYYCCK